MRLAFAAMIGVVCLAGAPAKAPAPAVKPGQVVPFQDIFMEEAGADWCRRAAQCKVESGFNPNATSWVGAAGIAQWMPGSWRYAIRKGWVPPDSKPTDVRPAIRGQVRYIAEIKVQVHGGEEKALGGYNCGPQNVIRAQYLADQMGLVGPGAWLLVLHKITGINKKTGEPNAKETRDYIKRNDAAWVSIKRKAGIA